LFLKIDKPMISGIFLVALFSLLATLISKIGFIERYGLSALVIGIVMGMIYANGVGHIEPKGWNRGIAFSAKKILRFAIVLYGFRITFQEIASIGVEGALVSFIMLSSTFILGIFAGIKLLKMDRDTSILNASGASVCGAAAVLATEPVLKSEEYKVAIAVSMVVLFGTISMFLYPALYSFVIEDSTSIFHMSPKEFGIYVGSTIHEVAQVIAVPFAIPNHPEIMANSAVIVKMTRVMMIAPLLIILGLWLSLKESGSKSNKVTLVIPWFAVYFIGVAGFHSLEIVPKNIVEMINGVDTFLLTMAMTALGMGTKIANFKTAGAAPFYGAFIMFVWLVVGGFLVTKIVCSFI
jgi:uncharacterized integral membrane protein (TIGR00698 family)